MLTSTEPCEELRPMVTAGCRMRNSNSRPCSRASTGPAAEAAAGGAAGGGGPGGGAAAGLQGAERSASRARAPLLSSPTSAMFPGSERASVPASGAEPAGRGGSRTRRRRLPRQHPRARPPRRDLRRGAGAGSGGPAGERRRLQARAGRPRWAAAPALFLGRVLRERPPLRGVPSPLRLAEESLSAGCVG